MKGVEKRSSEGIQRASGKPIGPINLFYHLKNKMQN